ncbi:hypothetical protein [Collinsella tanakaei]|uniref:hypothetical protein n=1 Tax=Collinsella tanakaei TaxID=626935 RepID=UPI001959A997|nr:hypothetical protein [Collinsella tanakaei]MBM6866950.1 hypothetical protein [Collinsella tanakaei]
MRVIVETQRRQRTRLRVRIRRRLGRVFRRLAGVPLERGRTSVSVRRVSPVRTVVRGLVPDPLLENRQARAMAIGLLIGSIHVVFALANIIMGLISRSSWMVSVGIVIAALNVGKSYLASGALMSIARVSDAETYDSLLRCRRAGIALVILVLAMSSTVVRIVLDGFGRRYPGGLIYVYAAYAFVLIVVALVNLVRARRTETLAVKGVRAFNLANALISIFALQTVLLTRMDLVHLQLRLPSALAEGGVGGLVCIILVAMGSWLAVSASCRIAARARGGVRWRAHGRRRMRKRKVAGDPERLAAHTKAPGRRFALRHPGASCPHGTEPGVSSRQGRKVRTVIDR